MTLEKAWHDAQWLWHRIVKDEIIGPTAEIRELTMLGIRWLSRGIGWLAGWDLDEGRGYTCSIPFHKQKDGYSPFNALATFALAQGAALTAVAKGEGHDRLVLCIYAAIVLGTIAWIIRMLRATKWEAEEGTAAQKKMRAYDQPSIAYGRIVLAWTVFIGVLMSILGWMNLLPNQTTRIEYNKGAIACEPFTGTERTSRAGGHVARMDKWIDWIERGTNSSKGEQFIWLEQKTPFPESYKPFALDLICNSSFVFYDPVAFLIKQPEGDYKPTYRQLEFRKVVAPVGHLATVDVPDANKGEYIVILLFARDPNNKKHPRKDQYLFQLIPHFDTRFF